MDVRAIWALILLAALPQAAHALGEERFVAFVRIEGAFPIVADGAAAPLHVGRGDWPGVVRAAGDLAADVRRVTGIEPEVRRSGSSRSPTMVIVGTIGRSALVDRLAGAGKIDVSDIEGRWESFVLQTVDTPLPGVDRALVIAGSDERGTIYGIYTLSEQIGISPWYWWADAAPAPRDELWFRAGRYRQGEPSVRYRGIFLNDEYPDLDRWVRHTYGERPDPADPDATVANFNGDFYARIFEVMLRLKANTLWPAMWNNAFAGDDPRNARLADEYGIVMGTSHQEPMMRAQKEWDRHEGREHGNWNYAKHPDVLNRFWREGVRARAAFENVYTIGLRGENDTEMVHGEAESVRLLEEIVGVQRRILREEVNPDVTRVPQVWTLYKEVQGYYERGLRVPGDVTLLWAEDNWGNLRRLPAADELDRAGGAGVYYHFDYHGGPRSYQWINTSPIAKIQEQMSLAAKYGADRIWIVNVGHFKGYEFPTEYFLDLAWDTGRWRHDNVNEYTRLWCEREFGAEQAAACSEVLAKYTKYNGRRKPELLSPSTYSLVQDREWDRVVEDFREIVTLAEGVRARLPEREKDAFYQLVLFPARASAVVNEIYRAAAMNALYAKQGRAATNRMAARTRALFREDAALTKHYNDELAGGRWKHFMDQPHIGYTSWRDPPENSLEAVPLTTIEVPPESGLGVAVEGDVRDWPAAGGTAALPQIDAFVRQRPWIDVFNRGRRPFGWTAVADSDWIVLGETAGTVEEQTRFTVAADWEKAPPGTSRGTVTIEGAGEAVTVSVELFNPAAVSRQTLDGFVESRGVVSIEPEHYTANVAGAAGRWIRIEDYGRTLSGMRADAPGHAPSAVPGTDAPALEYRLYLFTPGTATASLILSPTLNFVPGRGLRVAASFDDEPPRVLEIVPAGYDARNGNRDWERAVMDNARTVAFPYEVRKPGYHTLKIRMIDPAVVVQKIVVATASAPEQTTYLGPPESPQR